MSEPKPTDCDDVEITPEMIEAGVYELQDYDPEGDDLDFTVRWIFEAMMRAAKKSPPPELG